MSFTPSRSSRSAGRAETRSRTKDDVRRVMQAVDKVRLKRNIEVGKYNWRVYQHWSIYFRIRQGEIYSSILDVFPSYISLFGTSCLVNLLLFLIFNKQLSHYRLTTRLWTIISYILFGTPIQGYRKRGLWSPSPPLKK